MYKKQRVSLKSCLQQLSHISGSSHSKVENTEAELGKSVAYEIKRVYEVLNSMTEFLDFP